MWYNAQNMKKAFTLVELLIVVLVLATLMSIVFRLSSIGSDATKRSTTIDRLQRLENCLSGYYAAFGSYPPVRLHNSRDFRLKTSEKHHVQSYDQYVSGNGLEWNSVKAACMAQPVGCEYPFPNSSTWETYIEALSDMLVKEAEENGGTASDYTFTCKYSGGNWSKEIEWRDAQYFKFGLLSYLMPRYLFMLGYSKPGYPGEGCNIEYRKYVQWTSNNTEPCDAMDGSRMSWQQVQQYATSGQQDQIARVANIPSQAACARWMANLEGIVWSTKEMQFYGVSSAFGWIDKGVVQTTIHGRGDYENDNTSGQYVLDWARVVDGWYNDFYYYSPAPYQSYVLWSGGPNGYTFPPWVDRTKLDSNVRATVEDWTADDIVGMSN